MRRSASRELIIFNGSARAAITIRRRRPSSMGEAQAAEMAAREGI
jgi:hypothetical protein